MTVSSSHDPDGASLGDDAPTDEDGDEEVALLPAEPTASRQRKRDPTGRTIVITSVVDATQKEETNNNKSLPMDPNPINSNQNVKSESARVSSQEKEQINMTRVPFSQALDMANDHNNIIIDDDDQQNELVPPVRYLPGGFRGVLSDEFLHNYHARAFETQGMEQALTEDCYSIMYLCPVRSPVFFSTLLVFGMQVTILVLLFFDMVDFNNSTYGEYNPLQMPPGVDSVVNLAQLVSIIMIAMTIGADGDLTAAIGMFADGHNKQLSESYPGATWRKWLVSAVTQFTVGMLMTVDLFVLVMQSTSVLDLCLNFAALEFVGLVDNWAFRIAEVGLISDAFQRECEVVKQVQVPSDRRVRSIWMRRSVMPLVLLGLVPGFGILVGKQWNGEYLCQNLYVQFSDEPGFTPGMAYYSGFFHIQGGDPGERYDARTWYMDSTNSIALRFCSSQGAWVFVEAQNVGNCEEFFARSPPTDTFDVTDVANGPWVAPDPIKGTEVIVNWLLLTCRDCQVDEQFCPPERGTCVNRMCECKKGFIGLSCEFSQASCREMNLPENVKSLSPGNERFFQGSFNVFVFNGTNDWIEVNQRPVLIASDSAGEVLVPLIIYTGRRWALFAKESDQIVFQMTVDNDMLPYLAENGTVKDPIHTLRNLKAWGYRPYFFSDAMDYGSPLHAVEPLRIQWFHVKYNDKEPFFQWAVDMQQPVPSDAVFQCSQCNHENFPCLNGGKCAAEIPALKAILGDICLCANGYGGKQCEIEPVCAIDDDCYGQMSLCYEGHCSCAVDIFRTGDLCQFVNESIVECMKTNVTGTDIVTKPCYNKGRCILDSLCWCYEDFYGPQCELRAEANDTLCGGIACSNGGVCQYWLDTEPPFCRCPDPFYGDQCQWRMNPEDPSDCAEGTCLNGGTCLYTPESDSDQCFCPDSHYGSYCEHEITNDDCYGRQCQNNGTCSLSGIAMCNCESPFFGVTCEFTTGKDDPSSCYYNSTCMHNGTCDTWTSSERRSPFCTCDDPYYGNLCQYTKRVKLENATTEACFDSECQNSGTCLTSIDEWPGTVGSGSCSCSDAYYGKQCELSKKLSNPSECFNFTCLNRGTCTYNRELPCKCPLGYVGSMCEIRVKGYGDHPMFDD